MVAMTTVFDYKGKILACSYLIDYIDGLFDILIQSRKVLGKFILTIGNMQLRLLKKLDLVDKVPFANVVKITSSSYRLHLLLCNTVMSDIIEILSVLMSFESLVHCRDESQGHIETEHAGYL